MEKTIFSYVFITTMDKHIFCVKFRVCFALICIGALVYALYICITCKATYIDVYDTNGIMYDCNTIANISQCIYSWKNQLYMCNTTNYNEASCDCTVTINNYNGICNDYTTHSHHNMVGIRLVIILLSLALVICLFALYSGLKLLYTLPQEQQNKNEIN